MSSTTILRPADPDHDFSQLAAWFSILEDEPSTAASLQEFYEKQRERIWQKVAVDEAGELVGFYWAARDRLTPDRVFFFLFVEPARRGQGTGSLLYRDLTRVAAGLPAQTLRVRVWDNCPEGRAFAERRGFTERAYQMAMSLNLKTFDDQPYDAIIARLQDEGFLFTSMGVLGNTEEAQRRLYALNNMTGSEIPGGDGQHPWASLADFQQSVCQKVWYKPDGQMVVIDTANGDWVAMSAITRFEGVDYAYNLHTGVDRRYRGRKLGQAVKTLALRYARDVLKVSEVRTHHNGKNLPMIAIDHKFGYVQLPGTFLMEKMAPFD